MRLPIDTQILETTKNEVTEDQGEYIRELRKNIDWLQEVTTENILANQEEFKIQYDKNCKPYKFFEGQLVLINDPVLKIEENRKLHSPWKGPFTIITIEGEGNLNARLHNQANGKIIRNPVHLNQLKPYHARDDVTGGEEQELGEQKGTTSGENNSKKYDKSKQRKAHTRLNIPQEHGNDMAGIENGGTDEKEVGDKDGYYTAIRIKKQKSMKGEQHFLVKWKKLGSKDSWIPQRDCNDALLSAWWATHTKQGKLRKIRTIIAKKHAFNRKSAA